MPMRRKPYFPQLIAALRDTLEHLEQTKMVAPDDPVLAELKSSVLRTLAKYDDSPETSEVE